MFVIHFCHKNENKSNKYILDFIYVYVYYNITEIKLRLS